MDQLCRSFGRLTRLHVRNRNIKMSRIQAVCRANYLSASKMLPQTDRPEPLIRMLDFAQRWTAAVDWRSVEETQRELDEYNAFLDPNVADEEGQRLRMPGRAGA